MKKMLALAVCAAVLVLTGCSGPNEIRVNGVRMAEMLPETGDTDLSDFAQSESASLKDRADKELVVYICGAVRMPAVYRLAPGSRVCDAIDAAGGFTPDADPQSVNQARLLCDEEMLIVYTTQETAQARDTGPDTGAGKVNLNSASKEQLMTLPGIGESKAGSIIRYREENGPFSCIEDVMNISGIKNSVYTKIRDLITV